ncbi:MAG: hypothetical protein RBR70_04015 [Arcobacter sp.]|jgi:hypothetical protein|uniref:hypothetical protein n=1 Tax=Arcobacter sp. TaxID=1872629 RepID=UPI002A755D96|nr:hypothetical protein [Arcobacter sp.]MDY3204223.1 hypothetical protein [Arcobacter sp.]
MSKMSKMSMSKLDELKRKNIEQCFIRISQAILITGCSESYIKLLIKENKIKSYLPTPKMRLIDYSSLMCFIKNNEEEN